MNTKRIVLSAIIAALPFTAWADNWVYTWTEDGITYHTVDAPLSADDTVIRSDNPAPYQMATIGEHDDEHIATTAYVKGAYNDTIAAVNKVSDSVDVLSNYVYTDVADTISDGLETKQDQLVMYRTEDPMSTTVYGAEDVGDMISHLLAGDDLTNEGLEDKLVSVTGVVGAINALLWGGRVEIYTTWDTNDTTGVSLKSIYDFN